MAEKGYQRGMERGLQQGIEQGMLLAIQSLMNNRQITAEEAMMDLGIEPAKQKEYAEQLKAN